jgi:hypothetical protein
VSVVSVATRAACPAKENGNFQSKNISVERSLLRIKHQTMHEHMAGTHHLLPRRIDLSLVEAVSEAQSTRLMLCQWVFSDSFAGKRSDRRPRSPDAPRGRRHMPLTSAASRHPTTVLLPPPVASAIRHGPLAQHQRAKISSTARWAPQGLCR